MNRKQPKYEVKISFGKKWDSEGTCFKKFIRLNSKIWNAFQLALQSQIAMEKDVTRKMWLSTPIKKHENIRFLNLTQEDYLSSWLVRMHEVEINTERLFSNSSFNTAVILDDSIKLTLS